MNILVLRFATALAFAVAFSSQFAATPAQAQQRPVPVMVGGEADFDACPSQGVAKGLRRGGDNFLAVRAGPGTSHRLRYKIRAGQTFNLCGSQGQWTAIVFGRRGQDCGVGSPIARRQPYRGPCRSGWVHRNFVRVTAG